MSILIQLLYYTFPVKVVRSAIAHFISGPQPTFAVTVVLCVASGHREVLRPRRPLLVQETLAVIFAKPV